MVRLGAAPLEAIKTVNYIVAGVTPIASAGELAQLVRVKVPGAAINFEPDLAVQEIVDRLLRPLDDSKAHVEWGWQCEYDQERIVDDFLHELAVHPQRYG